MHIPGDSCWSAWVCCRDDPPSFFSQEDGERSWLDSYFDWGQQVLISSRKMNTNNFSQEAENERMHLMTFLQLRHPGPLFRGSVILTQLVFTAAFSMAYLVSPHFCHRWAQDIDTQRCQKLLFCRFVGYLEEQAVVTYSDILQKMDEGKLPMWSRLPAPEIATKYWKLGEGAMMRDVILAIRLVMGF